MTIASFKPEKVYRCEEHTSVQVSCILDQISSKLGQIFVYIYIGFVRVCVVVVFKFVLAEKTRSRMFSVENLTMIWLVLPGALFPSLWDIAMSVGCSGGSIVMRCIFYCLYCHRFSGMPKKHRLSRFPCCSCWSKSEHRSTTVLFSSEISWSLWMIWSLSGCSWRWSATENIMYRRFSVCQVILKFITEHHSYSKWTNSKGVLLVFQTL